ncbi:pseudouridine-5'-phosphatase-like [Rhipicephalus microplus]|uniref:pseudouridine-5'-phosphatase-like n=1 Tax=Rhipicephalus microplus TaxID=6941 RepID=UPI003F6C7B55
MQVVMVPDPRMDQENRNRATLCIDSLADFKPELFGLPPYPAAAKKSPSRSESIKDIKPQAPGSKFKPVSYVIFDLDGLLLDTEKLYSAAVETVASRFSKISPGNSRSRCWDSPKLTQRTRSSRPWVCPWNQTSAERLVRHLHEHTVPMAIATGSAAPLFDLKMTRHHDVLALFHHVVCAGENPEVKRGKPHPDIFLVAASRFDGKPPSEKVLVFEDVVNGVTAALAAGMQVVMVPDPRIGEEHRGRATTCVTTLLEFKPELFGLPAFDTPAQDPKKLKHTSSGPSSVHHSLTAAQLSKPLAQSSAVKAEGKGTASHQQQRLIHVSEGQRTLVLAFMTEHPQLMAKATELQHGVTVVDRRRLWQELSDALNRGRTGETKNLGSGKHHVV